MFFPANKNTPPETYIKQSRMAETTPDNSECNLIFKTNKSKEKEPREINDINEINIVGRIEIIPSHT